MAAVSFQVTGGAEVVHDLTRFRQNVGNARPVFVAMAEHVAAMQRDQFQTEGRHYGPGWASLTPAYKAWKARRRPGRPILVFDGTLRDQAAPARANQFGFYKVTASRMEVGVSYSRTPHAKYHQEGASWTTKNGTQVDLPARPVMGAPTREDQKALTKILHTHIVKGVASVGR